MERNESGDTIPDWQTYTKAWAKVMPTAGREIYQSSQVQERVIHEMWVQDGADVSRLNDTMRLLLGTRVINLIAALRVVERGYWWFLQGVEAPGSN